MLVLHGIYDNGKIEIEEKDLPKVKAKVKIQFPLGVTKGNWEAAIKIINNYNGIVKQWDRDELYAR